LRSRVYYSTIITLMLQIEERSGQATHEFHRSIAPENTYRVLEKKKKHKHQTSPPQKKKKKAKQNNTPKKPARSKPRCLKQASDKLEI